MKAEWEPSEGYDAIAQQGQRVSIKTRVRQNDRDRSPTMGTFRRNKHGRHEFDVGWYVQLNPMFELEGIWELRRRKVAKLQDARRDKGISISKFKRSEKDAKIWPKQKGHT
jgi:hypothetical protein